MKTGTSEIQRRQQLVLIGGGHSHAIALRKLGMNPMPDVQLTLITNVWHTPYSGMLPGYVAGLYDVDDCHIDLRPLANFAQAQLVVDRAIALDLDHNRVICENHPPIAFDRLSIDIGSTPLVSSVPGAAEHTIPVKPISTFLRDWDVVVEQVRQNSSQPSTIAVVGGGVGGVELSLSVQAHLQRIYREAGQSPHSVQVHLFHRGADVLEGRDPWVRRRMQQVLRQKGIHLHLNESVNRVEAGRVHCESGLVQSCDRIFWVTQAAAVDWIAASGLATDDQGFIQVNAYLQSVSHPQVFAAGDIAAMVETPRPKAGVFAVRQGTPLVNNVRRSLSGKLLKSFRPQREFLILIGTGDRRAVASRGWFGFGPHRLLWWWKDRIDRAFMEQFVELPDLMADAPTDRSPLAAEAAESTMRCLGCGAKIGATTLARSLARLQADHPIPNRPDVVMGLAEPDDAAVLERSGDQVWVQTVDYLPALLSDPFLVGQLTVHHCMNDILAMGGEPHSALAIATLPLRAAALQEEMLYHLLAGVTQALDANGATLIGGHTSEGAQLALGLSCNGVVNRDRLLRKQDLKPGQALILTKSLGTGVLFAADMRLRAKGRWIAAAIASMVQSNQLAIATLRQYQVTACTDISGFGLLGHLLEMVQASKVSVELQLEDIPLLPGVESLMAEGIYSSLYAANVQRGQSAIRHSEAIAPLPHARIMFDPQTSGPLLAAVPADQASASLSALRAIGYPASLIGQVCPKTDDAPITILA
jgi:selenide, water dikinase